MSKQLKVRKQANGLAYEVYMEGGGSIPAALEGVFTHKQVAETAIQTFQAKVQDRVENGRK